MTRREPAEFVESFKALSRCIRGAAAQTYATFEVGTTQAMFLRYIGQNSRISQADLSRATQTDPALTGRVLETMVEHGWVRRKRSEEDRRQYVVELSAAGQRARKQVNEARDRVARQIAAALDDRDIEDFERVSKKILAAFDGWVGPDRKP